jgi:hypothetical protein
MILKYVIKMKIVFECIYIKFKIKNVYTKKKKQKKYL